MAERLYPNITLFIEIVLFLIIFMMLSKYLFKPVLKVLSERKKRIDGEREDARKLKDRTKLIQNDYSSKISEAKKEATKIIDEYKKEGEDLGKKLIDKARAENEKYYSESKQKIWADAEKLQKGLNATAKEVSKDLAAKILQ